MDIKLNCEYCGITKTKAYGSGRFCTSKCARTFSTSKDRKAINKKVSNTMRGKDTLTKEQRAKIGKGLSISHRAKFIESFKTTSFDSLGRKGKRLYIFVEQDYKCLICGLSHWLEKPITFEVDHIDGDTSNNSRENLRALCPNCHSQTPTWRRSLKSRKQN